MGVGWLFLLFAATAVAATYQAGAWSVDVSVAPDKSVILLGEPTFLSFTVKNLSAEDLQILVGGDYRNELGRPGSFQVRVQRSDGQWVDQPKVGFSAGGLIGPQPLPAGGTYVFRLFLPHWATFAHAGFHSVSCRRTLQLLPARAARDFARQPTTDVTTEADTKLEVVPRDVAALGELIAQYGEEMLRAEGGKAGDDAVLALAWIDDPRVVPYFRRAFAIRSYALKFIALHALGKFATDDAFAGLQAGMKTKPADLDSTAPDQAVNSAANIRMAAAVALRQCGHPMAREFLLAQRDDASEGVRITVLHALAELPDARAVPMLEEMTEDSSPRVRAEARRYLAMRKTKTK